MLNDLYLQKHIYSLVCCTNFELGTPKMNVLQAISISHRIFQLCNLSQFQLKKETWSTAKSRFLEIYSIIVVLLSVALLIYSVFFPIRKQTSSNDIGATVDTIQLFGIRIAHIVCVIEALYRRNEQQKLIKKIQEIDRIIEISLNIDVENSKLRSKHIKFGLLMLAMYLISELCIFIITALGPNSDILGFWILYLMPLLACGLRYFQYLLFVAIIRKRLRILIAVLGNVNLLNPNIIEKEILTHGKTPITQKVMKNLSLQLNVLDVTILLAIRDLYNRLWEISILVNNCFGFSMLVAVGVDFIAITSNFYWIFLNMKNQSSAHFYSDFFHITASLIWSFPHLLNIMTIALLCHKTVESTSEIALKVHNIQIDLYNDDHNSMIEQFSLQLLHQKIYFTAFGFFTIDCSLLYTIVGATTTYLIILIQFHMSEQKETSTKTS